MASDEVKRVLTILNNVGAIDERRGVSVDFLVMVLSQPKERVLELMRRLIEMRYVGVTPPDNYCLTPRGVLAASSVYS